ncbi:hypothetical protein KC19_6G073700 [Ceratodon purpureus]|uniref:BHLH domain-containing protein n=1 Tax=Ceratodon purpureus TaxID=3225 RepID=A0A8T0HD57_CERPU|nr:hypothetical protein KC19_6G073700 [Ceratodon purpureus]
METLGASYPRFWMHDNLLEQQHSFPQTPVDRFAGLVSERMHSELVSSVGHHGSVLAESPCSAPPHVVPVAAAPEFSGRVRDAEEENGHLQPARKLQKAGRERLRRDHLNEQFAKLADVLDPVRPKLDKGTILAESILAVNELRSDIARMKNEHIALSDESRDLGQEKAELQEEKNSLETEVVRLQDQRNQSGDNQSAAPGWRMDQPVPMANPQFPYPLMPLMTKSSLPSKDVTQDPNSPFFPPFLHPAYQTFGMFGSRPSPYMPHTHFPHPVQQIHVERPAARYPAPIHPTPTYPAAVPKSAQASDTPAVGTDLLLQTPGLTLSSTNQHSVSEREQPEKTTPTKGQCQDALRDSSIAAANAATADEHLASQLSLSPSSIKS